jgi:hypothetical protein
MTWSQTDTAGKVIARSKPIAAVPTKTTPGLRGPIYSGPPPRYAGCTDIVLWFERKDYLGWAVVYKMNLHYNWCFIADHVGHNSRGQAQVNARTLWFSKLAPLSEPFGKVSVGELYWNANPGRPYDSAWHERVSQGWHQCWGKCVTEFPWIWARLLGNGQINWDAGT